MGIESIDREACTNCMRCYEICPMDVFACLGNLIFIAYPEDCMRCNLCLLECKPKCIEITPFRSRVTTFPF